MTIIHKTGVETVLQIRVEWIRVDYDTVEYCRVKWSRVDKSRVHCRVEFNREDIE